jgi:hypothetical protein
VTLDAALSGAEMSAGVRITPAGIAVILTFVGLACFGTLRTHYLAKQVKPRVAATMYPVPEGAVEVGHVALQPDVYEEDLFFLTEQYPGTSALKHYANIFSRWRQCHGTDDGWQSFGDASRPEHVFVHQLIRRWVNPHNDVTVTLALRYESPGLASREHPSSDRQFVAVMRLQQVDAEKRLLQMGVVNCEKGT